MITKLAHKIFGSRNQRLLKQYQQLVLEINKLETKTIALSDAELFAKTSEFKQRYEDGTSLDTLLPEAFAVVRETAKRTMNMRHFDVQLLGGIVLHNGKIAEMRTGEGKTLVATLPAYLNALSGKSVHIVTVNDYLVTRDASWMAPIYEALGLTIATVVSGLTKEEKKQAYQADVIYGTNNEFGFDYLRDNMAFVPEDRMQRELNFAIIDEVDSILIDEARTPLIISGANEDSSLLYKQINDLIPKLKLQKEEESGDYTIDEKARQVVLTEAGHEKVEQLLTTSGLLAPGLSLYDSSQISLMHHVYSGIRAHVLFKRDVDYIVKQGEVIIVDEHTGRTMPGRRWSDGLHQAVEAKERVKIQDENQTLASITFQNYFRLYNKLSGMTGTADTEAYELQQIYNLEVVVIPTNKLSQRVDYSDLIYLTQKEKFKAIINDIRSCVERKQPVLVGTISIETSEYLSEILKKEKIKHQVLNAKFHEKEAQIIAEAGRPGSVTIATNMAGRGTDIVLGGALKDDEWAVRHAEVVAAGGLYILGTERHESRRIDNQLRGRSGRQGDPGSTRFYLSIEDNLMRIFISDGISAFLKRLGMEKGEAITHPMITKAVENAQRKVEGHHFDIRKQLLDFDNVANEQRRVIYKHRNQLMEASDISDTIKELRTEIIQQIVFEYLPLNALPEQWDIAGLQKALVLEFGQHLPIHLWLQKDESLTQEALANKIFGIINEDYLHKEQIIGSDKLKYIEKATYLNVIDMHWKEHLAALDYLRQSIHLRGYAQKDPKQEYKREAFELFANMYESIQREVISLLSMVREQEQEQLQEISRNAPCPCGSGNKYKQCHGKL